ncbi:hypothetical protein MPF99_00440 [Helicobacter pylori]|uniref:hypothetical protein n=1 Tax=Helicobacter pylori TaxID=210 RepID=UPI001FD60267|nr:hypothetical protein [Helicobacter pylori]UOS17965.1 hypothetical protein MPF99_00440 [Helicobacter pylori]
MHQIIRKILKKMIKKPHLDHTQALSSYVSGSLGTLKAFLVWVRKIFSNPLIDVTTKTSISQGVRRMKRKHSPYRRRYNLALLMFNMPRMQTQVVINGLM